MNAHASALPCRADPLTAEAFAPFGEVISTEAARERIVINGGTATRCHDLANIDAGPDGRTIVSIFSAEPRPLPFLISLLERHPLGSQAFMPLSGRPYLVVVAPAGETIDESQLRIFLAAPNQGVNFARGVWHHPLLALEAASDFLVIDRAGPGKNCDEHPLAMPRWIER